MAPPNQERHGRQLAWEPLWLRAFLEITFFGSCTAHESPRNELKRYCIDCQLPACLHCIDGTSHAGHNILKIYRYSRKDAVLKSELREHMDCSRIQAYRCNNELVLVLNPIPHRGSQESAEDACVTCIRKLIDPTTNRYCSIACKLEAFLKNENDSDAPSLEIPCSSQERKPKRSRKGIPRRSTTFLEN